MNIAIISSHASPNTKDLVAAFEALSVSATVYQLSDLVIDTNTFDASSFMQHDAYVFRGYNRSHTQAQSLAAYLVAMGKLVIDRQLAGNYVPSKFYESLIYRANGIPHPRVFFIRDASSALIEDIKLPVVVKDVDSQKGKGVRLCHSHDELRDEIIQNGGSIIFQQFIPMQYDIRVICVGDKAIGAIRREVVKGDFRTNVSLGSSTQAYELNEEVAALALRAHKAMQYDISGVDIGFDADSKPFVIETNVTPEWQGFKAATGIDVAGHIARYIIERHDHGRV